MDTSISIAPNSPITKLTLLEDIAKFDNDFIAYSIA